MLHLAPHVVIGRMQSFTEFDRLIPDPLTLSTSLASKMMMRTSLSLSVPHNNPAYDDNRRNTGCIQFSRFDDFWRIGRVIALALVFLHMFSHTRSVAYTYFFHLTAPGFTDRSPKSTMGLTQSSLPTWEL